MKIIGTFITNTLGWEMDSTGYIIETPFGKIGIVETNHGSKCDPEFDEEALKILNKWKKEYQEQLDSINAAIELIKANKTM